MQLARVRLLSSVKIIFRCRVSSGNVNSVGDETNNEVHCEEDLWCCRCKVLLLSRLS